MLYHLFHYLADYFSGFNVFQYLTFRSAAALVTGIIIGLVIGKPMIRWLKNLQPKGQPIRDDGPQHHLIIKTGTPTMGGLLILLSMTISTLLWANLTNPFIWLVLIITLGFGVIGFYDDFFKVRRQSSKGLSATHKLLLQAGIALIVLLIFTHIYQGKDLTYLYVPFFKDFFINLGWFFIPFAIFVIIGTSNAVNLTDGLDGLAIVPAMIAASCFALIAYLAGNSIFANYLQIQYVPGIGEIAVLCGAMIGAGLSFLWFNAPPASVFMGDTGSLAMGGALGAISVMTKHEIVLAIIGGLFVMEAVSVIVQVVSFKTTGKRVFRMAPLHHHFEQKGWAESTIVIRFWIIALILAMIGLSTLKLR